MPMPPYKVVCQHCGEPATLKVASEWSDGETRELKTYAIVCLGCLNRALAEAKGRHTLCQVHTGETLEKPGVWELAVGRATASLIRRADLEG